MVWSDLGDKNKALEYYEQALPLSRQVGDKGVEATTLNNIGLVLAELNRYSEALEALERAVQLNPHNKLNIYWRALIRLPLKQYRESLVDLGNFNEDDTIIQSYTAFWIGLAQHLLSEDTLASDSFDLAQSLVGKIEDVSQQNRVAGLLAVYQGELDRAKEFYAIAIQIHKETKNNIFAPRFYLQILEALFPERADIQEVRVWFLEQLK
jgi:tetratricopeptide (TPR) repeat protein